jgi:hypothetical protein
MRGRHFAVLAAFLTVATPPATIAASVLFANFDGINKTLTAYGSAGITGPGLSDPVGLYITAAQSFLPEQSAYLDSLQLMLNVTGGSGNLYALITSSEPNPTQTFPIATQPDVGGLLETIQLEDFSYQPTLITALSSAHPELMAGSEYWVWLITDRPIANFGWIDSVHADDPTWNGGPFVAYGGPYPASFARGYGPDPYVVTNWTTGVDRIDGFSLRVIGTVVPEPAPLALLGLTGLGFSRRRQ